MTRSTGSSGAPAADGTLDGDPTARTVEMPVVERPARGTATHAGTVRLRGIDAARGVALIGMVAIHSLDLVNPDGSPTGAFSVFAGRSAALFAVLAGVGIAFMTKRAPVPRTRARAVIASLLARAIVIGVIGLLMGWADPDYTMVILPFYAILFVFAIPLVFLRTRAVVLVGVVAATLVPWAITSAAGALPGTLGANPTISDVLHDPIDWFVELTMVGEYPALPWIAYLCAGLVIGRMRLRYVDVAAALTLFGTVAAVGAHVASGALMRAGGYDALLATGMVSSDELDEMLAYGVDGLAPFTSAWWLVGDAPHTATPFDLVATIGSSCAVIGVMLLSGHLTSRLLAPLVSVVLVPLAAIGSMTLTMYVAHIWFVNSEYDSYEPQVGFVVQIATAVVFATAIRTTAGRGPLEALTTAVATRVAKLASMRIGETPVR